MFLLQTVDDCVFACWAGIIFLIAVQNKCIYIYYRMRFVYNVFVGSWLDNLIQFDDEVTII